MLKWSISTNSKISDEDVFLNTTAEEQESFRSAKINGEVNEEVDNDNDKFNEEQLSANELNKINEDVEIKDNKSDENITEIILHKHCHHQNKTGANGPVNTHASEFQKVGHFPETKCESKFSTWDEFANESKLILECIAVFKLWIEGVTNKRIAEGRLFSRLENGTTIKSFLSKIHSGNIPLQRFRSSFKWSRNKNVGYFLKECKKLRVEEEHLFEPEDWQYVTSRPHNLFHDKNWKTSVKKILWTVYRLGLKLKTHRKHRTFVEGVDFTPFAKLFNSHTLRTPSSTIDFQPAEVVDFEEPMYFQEYRLPKLEQATFKPPVVYATQNNRPALFCKQQQPEEKAADKLSTTPAFVKAVEGRKLNLPVFLNKQRSVDSALRTNEVSTMEKRRHTIDRLDDRKRVTFEEHVIHHCCSVENLAKPFFQQQNHPPPNYEEFIKMMKANEEEEDAEPISFHSYVQPKDPSSNSFNKFLMKSPRLFKRDKNNNNQPSPPKIRTILKQKSIEEAKSPGTDEGYSTSSFNEGTPLLQSTFIYQSPAETCVASKQELNDNSVEEMKREKVLKQPTTITNNNHYQQPLQPLPTRLPITTTLPLQKDLDILDAFLSEFTSPEKKEELTPVEPIDHKPVKVPGFHVSATYLGKSHTLPNPPVTKLKGIESSQSSGTLKDRLTSDLQTVVSDLLTLGKNKNTLEEGDHLVDLDNLDEFFENIGIADVTDSDDDPTYDSGIEETMPALLKDGGSKPPKSQKSKHSDSKTEDKKKELRRHKKKNDDEATSRRKRDDRTDSKTKKPHDRPSLERRHNKTEPINMKKARQDEKASDMRRTNSDSFVPRKQRDKQTSIKGKTIPQTSGRTVPDSIPLKRNNSVHIKGEEYILDDGKQQVYLRSKADEAPPLPNKIDLLNDYDRNIRTLLRTDDPHIINQLGVSPDIIKLLKEEESFWQKQQELKKWRESRDRQVSNANIHIPPVRPKRHPASSKSEIYPSLKEQRNTTDNSSRKTSDHSRHDRTEHSRHNTTDNSRDLRRRDRDRADHKPRGNREQNRDRYHPMSESEREMEEEKLAREAERLMRLRAEQIHVLNVSRENLLREEKNIQRQLSTDTPRSGTWDNPPSSSRSSAKAYLSPDSEPIYDRSKQSVMKNMRQMKTTHERNESCFSDDEVFNQKSPTRRVDNRGYFSDHDVFRESSTFQARPVHKSHRRTKLRCTACNRPINDERLITVEEKGYNWHGRCFVCVVCRVFLNDKHVVRVRVVDNRLHCRFCYSASNGDELMSEV